MNYSYHCSICNEKIIDFDWYQCELCSEFMCPSHRGNCLELEKDCCSCCINCMRDCGYCYYHCMPACNYCCRPFCNQGGEEDHEHCCRKENCLKNACHYPCKKGEYFCHQCVQFVKNY